MFTAPESNHREEEEEESEAGSLGLTCISSSFDWMSGGKSAAPQVNGSNGSAPNRSLSAKENTSARKEEVSSTDATAAAPWRATKANADGQRGQYASNINGFRITFFSVSQRIYEKNVIISFTRIVLYLNM